jgi:hypothetical protein
VTFANVAQPETRGGNTVSANRVLGWALASLIGLVSAWIRIDGLTEAGISHPEFYTARLEFPDYVEHPHARVTLPDLARSVYSSSDIHPPGYYVLSWVWNGCFGTSLAAIRSLSVLAGLLTVYALFWMGARREGLAVGALASLLLGLHSLHVIESTTARIWIWPAALAVASVILLDRLHSRRSPGLAAAYVAVLALGVWTEYSFAFFLGAQILYEVVDRSTERRLPATVQLQALAAVLSLPILVYLRSDLEDGSTGYLGAATTRLAADWLRLGFLADSNALKELPEAFRRVLEPATLLVGAGLLARGLAIGRRRGEVPGGGSESIGGAARILVATLTAGLVLAHYAWGLIGWKTSASLVVATGICIGAWPLLDRLWPVLTRPLAIVQRALPEPARDTVSWHAVVPAAAMLAVSPFVGFLEKRVLLMTVPFVLLVVARGVVNKVPPAIAALGVALVLALGVGSARAGRSSDRSSVDYGGISHALEARMAPDDWIVLKYDWYSAPLHFYFKEPTHHVVRTADLPGRLLESAPARIWIINFAGTKRVERLPELRAQLAPYVATEEVRAKNIVARLFERDRGETVQNEGTRP